MIFATLSLPEWWAWFGAAAVLVLVWLALDWWLYASYRKWRVARRVTMPSGYVKLSAKDIRMWSWREYRQIANAPLPPHVQSHIYSHKPRDLARVAVDLLNPEKAKVMIDQRRAITVAAALFGFQIPHRLLLLDEVTAAYFKAACRELEPVYVSPSMQKDVKARFHIAESDTLTAIGMSRYLAHLVTVGAVLIYWADEKYYPSFDYFATAFRASLKAMPRSASRSLALQKDIFSDAEIKSIVTAYAALTMSRIPRCYVNLDATAAAIIHQPVLSQRLALATAP